VGPPASLLTALRGFRGRFERRVGKVEVLLLFGSQATGRAGPDSDVDVLIVSPAFQGKTYIGRAAETWRCWELPLPVDFLCYTPEEYDRLKGQVSIVREALREGVAVAA